MTGFFKPEIYPKECVNMMKYCPYCGAALADGAASFCMECGKKIPETGGAARETEQAPQLPRQPKKSSANARKKKGRSGRTSARGTHLKEDALRSRTPKDTLASPVVEHDDGYDGYYDDVLPPDLGRTREGVDKTLVKRIGLLVGIVLLVVVLCVLMLYLL